MRKTFKAEDLCSAQWIADFVGVTVQAVNGWEKAGYIEPVQYKGSRNIYYWPDVRKFLIQTERIGPNGKPWKKVETA